jgi:hypothetical protein
MVRGRSIDRKGLPVNARGRRKRTAPPTRRDYGVGSGTSPKRDKNSCADAVSSR